MSVRMPLALTLPLARASAQDNLPVASRIQVSGSVSTTLGGVPRVCRGPATHWTAPYGGTRTSTEWPGARRASAASSTRTASRTTPRSGSVLRSRASSAAVTAAELGCAGDTTGRYDALRSDRDLTLPSAQSTDKA